MIELVVTLFITLSAADLEPVRIITGKEPSVAAASIPNYFAWLSVACSIAAIALLYWLVRRGKRRPAEVRAFEKLAKSLKISAAEQELLQKMSIINGQISPLAMLVSPSAFNRCRESLDRAAIGSDKAILRQLSAKLKL